MRGVWVVREESLRAAGVALAGEQGIVLYAVHGVFRRRRAASQRQDRGKKILHCGLLGLDLASRNRQTFLLWLIDRSFGPRRNERHPHAAFIVRALFAAQRRRAGDFVFVAERRVG